MDVNQLLSRLAVTVGIGLLIGLERGWKTRETQPGQRAAGIRTFALIGVLGGLVAALARAAGDAVSAGFVLGFGFAVFGAIFAMLQRDADRAAGSYSATTMVVGLLTFVLGAYAVLGDLRVAAAAAVGATGILAARQPLHAWVARITWPELRSGLVLLAMTFIVLPIMPDVEIGPAGGVNPREVWLIAIILAAVSFLGYAGVKFFGETRGVLLSSFAGGLVSSTAVALTNSRQAAAETGASRLLAAGVSTASAVSFLRVIVIVSLLAPRLLVLLGPALGAALVVATGHALASVYWRADSSRKQRKDGLLAGLRNPFSFWPVVGFAIFLGAVILLGRVVGETFGEGGALLGAAAVGLADVDAVTISVARLVPQPLSTLGASEAILAAVASNMLSKLMIAAAVGRGRFAGEVALMTIGCWMAALVAFWGTLALGNG